MSKINTIIKKDLKRFFSDKRMLLSLILPGLLIFFLYSVMGSFMKQTVTVNPNEEYSIVVVNKPKTSTNSVFSNYAPYNVKIIDNIEIEDAKLKIKNEELDLLIVFDKDFDEKISLYQKPNVSLFYNSISKNSSEMYNLFSTRLSSLSMKIDFIFLINSTGDTYDLATKEDASLMMVTMIAPFLLVIFLFSGCMSIATEAIAGEKERGTIATLLVTPTKRRDIAIGKILALSITSLFSSFISFIGLMASLPKLMNLEDVSILSIYNIPTYLGILFIIIMTIIFFTVIMSLVSILAKSVKEASQYAMPVMIAVMALSMPSMLGSNLPDLIVLYFIPVLNTIQCLSGLFSMSVNYLGFVITIISNIVYISIGVYLLIKMFKSELKSLDWAPADVPIVNAILSK